MSQKEDAFAEFDVLLEDTGPADSPWQDGKYLADVDLLRQLIALPLGRGDKQESGRTARGIDAWVAHELRRAGFPPDEVWPRRRRPRVLPEKLSAAEQNLENLARELQKYENKIGKQLTPRTLRSAIRKASDSIPGSATAYILGDFYLKQIDVGLSSWRRGPDILISTKTMFSSYLKNLKNRHEEAVGEVSSLRRRHPMAAMGYVLVVHESIHEDSKVAYEIAHDILTRLRRPMETFDATMLVVGQWDNSLEKPEVTGVSQPSSNLNASRFFTDLVDAVMTRTPISEHQEVRNRRAGAVLPGLAELSDEELIGDEKDPDQRPDS